MLRKDPQKTAGFSVMAILGIGALILYAAYLRRPPAAAPAFTLAPKPAARPTTQRSEELLADAQIIQANSRLLEQRRDSLEQARALRALDRARPGSGRRPPPPEARSALERLFRPRPAAATIKLPTTAPTTQAVAR
jgi:hypothetical protein